jgi:hypothetical protein
MVYRVRDGLEGRIRTFDALYPYHNFSWLVVPSNIEAFRVSR